MKQHITVKQLNELSEKGKERLREWWKPELGDKFVQKHYHEQKKKVIEQVFVECDGWHCSNCEGDTPYSGKLDLPLLSIGQMIEFLDNQNEIEDSETLNLFTDYDSGHVKCWVIQKLNFKGDQIYCFASHKANLCDVLWEAVRQVLK